VDLDYEALRPMDLLLSTYASEKDIQLLLAEEPEEHSRLFMQDYIVSNAIIITRPFHPLLNAVLKSLKPALEEMKYHGDTSQLVMYSTGPFFLTYVYRLLSCLSKTGQVTAFNWTKFTSLASNVNCSGREMFDGSKYNHIRLLGADILSPKPLFSLNSTTIAQRCNRSTEHRVYTQEDDSSEGPSTVSMYGADNTVAFAQHHWCGTWW